MILTRKVKTFVTLLSFAAVASAQFSVPQNARMNSMANTFIIDDIADVYRYPVLMNDYYGNLQATFNTPIIGIKNMNDMLSIGLTANTGTVLNNFYSSASSTLEPLASMDNRVSIPHLLLGFDLGTAQLGADLFFEYARFSEKLETTGTGGSEQTTSALLMNTGLILSGKMDVGFPVMAKIGLGFPSIGGESKTGDQVTTEIKSEKGLYMETGAEAKPTMLGLDWTAGFGYTFEDFQFQVDENIDLPDRYSELNAYLGFEYDVLETAIAALQYQILRTSDFTYEAPPQEGDDNPRRVDENWSHIFSAGVENTWVKPWKLDAFQLRAGMLYGINMDVEKYHSETGDSETNNVTKRPADDNGFVPTMGLGMGKGFFQLDMYINMGSWSNGFFSGPDVGTVTATMKF
ncbi:MAG: hypothetical protein ACLFVQ_11180 [Chitinispirillaceae bacterium]